MDNTLFMQKMERIGHKKILGDFLNYCVGWSLQGPVADYGLNSLTIFNPLTPVNLLNVIRKEVNLN